MSTPDRADLADETKQKVDGGLYLENEAPQDNRNNWAAQHISFEWKKTEKQDDPFVMGKNKVFGEAKAGRRKANLGQIIVYASEIFLHQHRLFHFTVVILGVSARIIRWDRSGAVVSEKFNYKTKPHLLCQFLWRFCHLTDTQQGYDPSAVRIEKGLAEWNIMEKAAQTPLWLQELENPKKKTKKVDVDRKQHIENIVKGIIEGETRVLVSSMKMEEIF